MLKDVFCTVPSHNIRPSKSSSNGGMIRRCSGNILGLARLTAFYENKQGDDDVDVVDTNETEC